MGLRLKKMDESGKPQKNADRKEKDYLMAKRQKGCEHVRENSLIVQEGLQYSGTSPSLTSSKF